MKKSLFLTASLLLTSLSVQAIPPPPPLPPAIGYISAHLKIQLSITDVTKCDGYFCEQKNKECELTVRVPVVKASQYDEGFASNVIASVDGKSYASCMEEVQGYKHMASLEIYASLDENSKALKIVTNTRSNKYTQNSDLSTDNSNSSVNVISSTLPSYKARNSLLSQVNKPYDFIAAQGQLKTAVANTTFSISTVLEMPSLQIEPAN
jgi:hypothetical protein